MAWETFCTTWAGAAGPWEKYRALPPRLYPPALRGKAPPVKLGRRALAKGARPENCATRREVLELGSLDRSKRAALGSELTNLRMTRLTFWAVELENHRPVWRLCCRRAA